jgi:signal transduction histidine kinase/putative methionine-R-sulfoxide reductase with GAF domain
MATVRKTKDDRGEIPRLLQEQYKNLFSEADVPPAPMNIREMEALRKRVAALEAELAGVSKEGGASTPPEVEVAGAVSSESAIEALPPPRAPEESSAVPPASSSILGRLAARIGAAAREFGQSGLQMRLTALVLLATVPLLIGIAAFISNSAESRIEASANEALQQNTDAMTTNISTWLDQNVRTLQEMVSLPSVANMQPWSQEPVLKAVASAHPYMYLVSTTDLTGMNVARNDGGELTDYEDRVWYKNAVAGSDLTFQTLIGRTSGRPALVASAPIRSPAGNITGVGMFAADLTNLSEQTRVQTLGNTGFVYLLDAENNVLAHPDPAFTTGELRNLSEYPPVAALRLGKTGLINFTDENGASWRAYGRILENGWVVITQQQESEILAPARDFQRAAYASVLIGSLLMLLLLWFSIRRSLQPIGALTEAASAIAAGDLNRSIEVRSRDEIGVLARAFNSMSAQLRETFSNLEQRIVDRTHDLQLASDVGRAVSEKAVDLDELLTSAVETIRERFDLYYCQIYLTNPAGTTLTLRAGTGDVGAELIRRRHHLDVGAGSLNGRAAKERRAVIVADTAENPDFLPNPLLPDTRSEMAIPLITSGKVVGVLDMQSTRPGALAEANLSAFEVLAGQLAVALQNSALLDEAAEARTQVEEQVRRLSQEGWREFLDAIEHGHRTGFAVDGGRVVPLDEAPSELPPTEKALEIPIRLGGSRLGAIQLGRDHSQQWQPWEAEVAQATAQQLAEHIDGLRLLARAERYRAMAEESARRLTGEGWEAYKDSHGEPAQGYVYDLNQVKVFSEPGDVASGAALRQPLMVRNETIGELAANVNGGSDAAAEILAAVAERTSTHIETLRLSEELRIRADELGTLNKIIAAASQTLDLDAVLTTVLDNVLTAAGFSAGLISLVNPATDALELGAIKNMPQALHDRFVTKGFGGTLCDYVAVNQSAVALGDLSLGGPIDVSGLITHGFRRYLGVPIMSKGQVLGTVCLFDANAQEIKDALLALVQSMANQIGIAVENARLYAEQSAAVTRLRELDGLKTAFLANMSHELRTPLNSILGFADVVLEGLDGPLTENMSNDVLLIQKNGQHLLHLINDVLDMAKIEAGRMNLIPEKFRLHEIMEDAVSIATPLASAKSLPLNIEKASDREVEIEADRTRIRQVLLNLVTNAVKFTEQGKVSICARRQDDKVLLTVRDTGVGIPQDHLENVFLEFTQVDTSETRRVGGTGLGLPISRRLIEMHSGRMWAESSGVPGEGSTFYVELPIECKILEPIEQRTR